MSSAYLEKKRNQYLMMNRIRCIRTLALLIPTFQLQSSSVCWAEQHEGEGQGNLRRLGPPNAGPPSILDQVDAAQVMQKSQIVNTLGGDNSTLVDEQAIEKNIFAQLVAMIENQTSMIESQTSMIEGLRQDMACMSNTTYSVNPNGELTATDCKGGVTMLGYVVGPVVSLLLSSYAS